MQAIPQSPLHRYLEARDGLRLHYLDFPRPGAPLSVVCLPGLSRPAEDFEALAAKLNADGRRVLALDYRGRGDSQWDSDWAHYDLDVEEDDILRVLAQEGAELILHGHNHRDDLLDFEWKSGRIPIVGIASGSAARGHKGEDLGRYNLVRIARVGRAPHIELTTRGLDPSVSRIEQIGRKLLT